MTECGCCSVPQLPTYTEAYRTLCEANHAIARPLAERRAYLDRIEKVRGTESRFKLQDEMTRIFNERRKK